MKKKLMIGLPVLLLVALFVAKTIFLAPTPPDPKKLAVEPGAVYTMATPFVVNLADQDSSPHFAKVGVALRFSKLSEGLITPPKGDKPAQVAVDSELRDIVIGTLQGHSSSDLDTPAGRERVKKQILTKVNKQTDLKITDVYYTEFAVQ